MDSDSEWLRRALLERGYFEAAAVLASDTEKQHAEEEEEEAERIDAYFDRCRQGASGMEDGCSARRLQH